MSDVRPLRFEREDGTVTARGAQFPSGDVIVQWNREAFPEDDRTQADVTSHYRDVEDAEQCAGEASVIYENRTAKEVAEDEDLSASDLQTDSVFNQE